jgi:hypothetical protein
MSMHKGFSEKIDAYHEDRTVVKVVDMHVHLVTFLQTTEGLRSLLNAMQSGNISRSLVCGLAVRKKWEYFEPHPPSYYLDDDARCYYWSATDEVVASEFLKLTHFAAIPKKVHPQLRAGQADNDTGSDYRDCRK